MFTQRRDPLFAVATIRNDVRVHLQVQVQRFRCAGCFGLVRKEAGTFIAERSRVQCRRERVVGRDRTERCYVAGVSALCLVKQVFEFANLVATVKFAGEVIAFNRNVVLTAGSAQCHRVDRCGQLGEPQPGYPACKSGIGGCQEITHRSNSIEIQ